MSIRSLKFCVLSLAAGLLLTPDLLAQRSAARAQGKSLIWVEEKVVTVAQPVTVRGPRKRRRVRAPLMTLQWRVMKIGADGNQNDTNPVAVFYPGDRLRLAVKVNQPGYLTIVHQSGPDKDGAIVFPDSRINNGQNYVEKNQELIIPSACPASINPHDCALVVAPPAGVELFTLVFSRDLISDLTIKAAQAGGLKPQLLQQLKAKSGQVLKRVPGVRTGPYAIWIVNTNTKDNGEIIETLVLNKGNVQANR